MSVLVWVGVLVAPWQPWRTRERLDADGAGDDRDLRDVTVLIPARNEAAALGTTLAALGHQGRGLRTIVVDEQSSDATAEVARSAGLGGLEVLDGEPLPPGWTGKLWALEQGRRRIHTPMVLLLDADIELKAGVVGVLCDKLRDEQAQLVSLMAELRMESFWEKLLMPAFVYFFKLLYPFALSNRGVTLVAAAAGGCILMKADALERIGGFDSLRGALIDDCTLARRVQKTGGRTWIGLTHSAVSLRCYERLASVWAMVTRTAFTQLGCSAVWLTVCSLMFFVAFAVPWLALASLSPGVAILGCVALTAMLVSYVPTLRYYGLSALRSLTMPLVAVLYLAMTWDSARRYWLGIRAQWRGRVYASAHSSR